MPEIESEQMLSIAQCIIALSEIHAGISPSLDEDVERLLDFHATMIHGAYLAVQKLFGDDTCAELKKLVNKVREQKFGSAPTLRPRIIINGAETGIFKKMLYGELNWEMPCE